jgi:hypothetical protein
MKFVSNEWPLLLNEVLSQKLTCFVNSVEAANGNYL